MLASTLLFGCGRQQPVVALPDQQLADISRLAQTPPMGWNSWNAFGCNIDERLIMRQADALVSSGMQAAGYQYINVDDCWQVGRDEAGNIVADPERFPSGIKALAAYVHARGLKFGLYTDRGTTTCAGRPGSQGYELQDARTYAAWGVDYLKEDNCHANRDPAVRQQEYQLMRDALTRTGRDIVLSICAWNYEDWMPAVGNLWRTTTEIEDKWASTLRIFNLNSQTAVQAGPGHWNDADMLTVGLYGQGSVGGGGMTDEEYRSQFALWAMMASPLIAGNDLTQMNAVTKRTLTNPDIIAVNQDPLGVQGTLLKETGTVQVWVKPLASGERAVLLLNTGLVPASGSVEFAEVGLPESGVQGRDLTNGASLGVLSGSYTASGIPAHGVVLLRLKDSLALAR